MSTISCARCSAPTSVADASYTESGQLVCRSCSAQVQWARADNDQRAFAAQVARSNNSWVTARLVIVAIKLFIIFIAWLVYSVR